MSSEHDSQKSAGFFRKGIAEIRPCEAYAWIEKHRGDVDYLAANHLRQSMRAVGSCFDNARMESFFATLKKELIYNVTAYAVEL